MSAHTCHARDCDVVVPRKMFMCRKHWYMLTQQMRDDVWSVYVPGQQDDISLVTPNYIEVTSAIIEWLAEKEGR